MEENPRNKTEGENADDFHFPFAALTPNALNDDGFTTWRKRRMEELFLTLMKKKKGFLYGVTAYVLGFEGEKGTKTVNDWIGSLRLMNVLLSLRFLY